MISKDRMNEHDWADWPEAQSVQRDAFTEGSRTNGELTRNDPRSCKTSERLLRVAARVLPLLEPEDQARLLPYVKRDLARLMTD
jgi:hypothetical protein